MRCPRPTCRKPRDATGTRTIVTELVVEDGQKPLLPGAYVNVHLTVPGNPNLVIVPSQALLFRAEGMQVATVGAGDHIHLQDVSLGDNLGSEVELLSRVAAADQIVVNPSLGLLEGQQVKVVQAASGYALSETSKPAQ